MKEFPKAASGEFSKAAEGDNFCEFCYTLWSGFQKPAHVIISSFQKPFRDKAFDILFNQHDFRLRTLLVKSGNWQGFIEV